MAQVKVRQNANSEDKVMIGCCNFAAVWGDKPANLRKMIAMMGSAAGIGVDILAFPELALTGYECEGDSGCGRDGMHTRLAETVPGPSTEEIARSAREHDIYVVIGLPERDKVAPDRVYNSAAVIGPEGVMGAYRKLNLGSPSAGATEQFCFTGGASIMEEIPVFRTRYGYIGVTICYDFWKFPEITRIQVMKGARILFNCTAASGTEPQLQMVVVTGARAHENAAFVASANLAGPGRTKCYFGHSTIAGPAFPRDVRIYAEGGAEEEIVSAAVSFRQLSKTYERRPFLEDRKKYSSDLILREFTKLSSMA